MLGLLQRFCMRPGNPVAHEGLQDESESEKPQSGGFRNTRLHVLPPHLSDGKTRQERESESASIHSLDIRFTRAIRIEGLLRSKDIITQERSNGAEERAGYASENPRTGEGYAIC